jgi:hypothetical protein
MNKYEAAKLVVVGAVQHVVLGEKDTPSESSGPTLPLTALDVD